MTPHASVGFGVLCAIRRSCRRFVSTTRGTTFASTLLSGGVSVAAAADYLGHSPAMLLSTYAHLMPADHDRARAAVPRSLHSID